MSRVTECAAALFSRASYCSLDQELLDGKGCDKSRPNRAQKFLREQTRAAPLLEVVGFHQRDAGGCAFALNDGGIMPGR
ncbi:MAG TPA: hypothetical protein VF511_05275, partial [Chthoniobacterales bacterium]